MGTLLIHDGFDRANGSLDTDSLDSGETWADDDGSGWSISGNEAVGDANDSSVIVTDMSNVADVVVAATRTAGHQNGLLARWVDTDNWYGLRITNTNQLDIFKATTAGGIVKIHDGTPGVGVSAIIEFRVYDSGSDVELEAWADGVLIENFTDLAASSPHATGKVGMRNWSLTTGRWDNFRVRDYDSPFSFTPPGSFGTIRPKPPLWAPGIQESHPLAQGLLVGSPFWEGGGELAQNLGSTAYWTEWPTPPSWIDSPYGKAIQITTSGGELIHQTGAFPTTTGFTCALLVRYHTASDFKYTISCTGGATKGWALYQRSGKLSLLLYPSSGTKFNDTFTMADILDEWMLLVFTWDAAFLRTYKDGIQHPTATAAPGTMTAPTVPLILGSYRTAGGNTPDVDIAGVWVWDYGFTPGQVAQFTSKVWEMHRPPDDLPLWVAATSGGAPPVGGFFARRYYDSMIARAR